jgi:peroxiredoxin
MCGLAFGQVAPTKSEPEKAPAEKAPAEKAPEPVPADAAERSAEQQVFDDAAAAVKRAKGITFRASVSGTEGMAQAFPSSRVEVKGMRTGAGGFFGWLVRVSGTMDRKDKDALPVDLAWTANSVEAVDNDKREVIERPTRQMTAAPGLQVASAARMKEVFAAEPFSLERGLTGKDAINYTNEGVKTFDGVECDVLLLDRAGRKSRWAIGKGDHFPRLYEQIMEGFISGTVKVEVTGVTLDETDPPAMKAEDVRVTVPEGYKETRVGVAPMPQQVPTAKAEPDAAELLKAQEGANAAAVPAPAPTPVVETPVATGPRVAPAFELKTPAGATVKLADLSGKVVVAYFFGSWCLECPAWTPRLSDAVKPLKEQGVEVLALSVRERDDANATSELAKGDYAYTHLLKADAVAKDYSVHTYPATFVIDKAGNISASWQGDTAPDAAASVGDAVRAALASAG